MLKVPDYIAVSTQGDQNVVTVNDILDRYWNEHVPTLSRRTQVDTKRHIEILRGMYGERDAETVKPKECGMWLNSGVKHGHIQRGKIMGILAYAYKLAVGKWFMCENNPMRDITLPKNKPRTRYISDQEFAAVYAISSARVQVTMDLALLTGQRQGDILKLRWDHIDPHARVIHLRQSKTGRRFGIYITEALEEVLVRAKRQTPALPRAYVVRNKSGERYTSAGFRSMWQRAMARAVARGVIKEPFRFHDIRAKAASDSPDMRKASELLGHQDERITKAVYDRSIRIVQPLR